MKSTATIYDIAERAGVSPRTVSRFFNAPEKLSKKTAGRIGGVVKDLRFRPNAYAGNVSRRVADTVAVLVAYPREGVLDELHQLILAYISRELCARCKDVFLIGVDAGNERRVIAESFRRLKFDRVILLTIPPAGLWAELQGSPFRAICINWEPENLGPNQIYVGIDYYKSSYDYATALLERGYRRVCHVAPVAPGGGMERRARAVPDAVRDFGHGAEAELIRAVTWADRFGDGEKAFALVREMSPRPDVVYCCDDVSAIGLLSAARREGLRVPEDLAIVGFDGSGPTGWCVPKITTVAQPWREMARAAIELVFDTDEWSGKKARRILLDTEIVWRESC